MRPVVSRLWVVGAPRILASNLQPHLPRCHRGRTNGFCKQQRIVILFLTGDNDHMKSSPSSFDLIPSAAIIRRRTG